VPRLEWRVDIGHVLTAVAALLTISAAWARTDAKIQDIDMNGPRAMRELRVEISELHKDLAVAIAEMQSLRRDIGRLESQQLDPKK
jgi:hypothetical protein